MTTTKKPSYVKKKSHQDLLTYQFIQTAKWVALVLLFSIGLGMAFLQYLHKQPISWGFLAICIASGLLLFWIGRCLAHYECSQKISDKTH
jgi:hypothetical protein